MTRSRRNIKNVANCNHTTESELFVDASFDKSSTIVLIKFTVHSRINIVYVFCEHE